MEPLNKISDDYYQNDYINYDEHISFMKGYIRTFLQKQKLPIVCRIIYEAEVIDPNVSDFEAIKTKTPNKKIATFPKKNKHALHEIQNETEINSFLDNIFGQINKDIEEYNQQGSGWVFNKSIAMFVKIAEIRRRGASYRELPEWIANKKCCINVLKYDLKCFLWSILAALHPQEKDANRVSKYKEYENSLNMDGIDYPVCCKNYLKFEKQNNQPINVYELYDEEGVIAPIYISKIDIKKAINIGLYKDHYVWIKNMSRLIHNNCHAQKGALCPNV